MARFFSLGATLFLLLAPPAPAADTRGALLVTPAWLSQHLTDPDLVLLHTGDPTQYETAHLPGARLVKLSDISVSDHSGEGLMLEMLPAEDLRRRLEALGISDRSRIVVYYAQGWVTPATRIVFTLDYAGLGARTSLLDGGLEGWVRAGQPTSTAAPQTRTGTLSALQLRPIIVDAAEVKSKLNTPGFAVVDARAAALYDGHQTGGSPEHPHKTGHIAGAHSVPFNEVADDNGELRTAEELKALFDRAGVEPGDTVIGYCHIGQQATLTLFAARTLGHRVLLYDGSFEDWSRRDLPVERPASGKQ